MTCAPGPGTKLLRPTAVNLTETVAADVRRRGILRTLQNLRAARCSPHLPRRVVFLSHSAAKTRSLGWRLGKCAEGDEILALSGPLGSGKTCLAQGLGRGLRVRRPISSPSFVLMKRYRGRLPLIHWDWYRLEDKGDLESSGFGDLQVERGIVVIEWADRFLDQIAQPFLLIEIAPTGPHSRRLIMTVRGKSPSLRRLIGDVEAWWVARHENHETD